jgi:hypothetical protein
MKILPLFQQVPLFARCRRVGTRNASIRRYSSLLRQSPNLPGGSSMSPLSPKHAARNVVFRVGCENTPLRLELNSYCDATPIME